MTTAHLLARAMVKTRNGGVRGTKKHGPGFFSIFFRFELSPVEYVPLLIHRSDLACDSLSCSCDEEGNRPEEDSDPTLQEEAVT